MMITKDRAVRPKTERCIKCNRKWNVGIDQSIPATGYLCEVCEGEASQSAEELISIKKNGYALNAYL